MPEKIIFKYSRVSVTASLGMFSQRMMLSKHKKAPMLIAAENKNPGIKNADFHFVDFVRAKKVWKHNAASHAQA